MPKKTYTIKGRIVNKQTKQGISALRVEAWDKDLVIHDFVGEAVSAEQGAFRIEFTSERFRELFFDRKPDLFFKVFHEGKQIHSTEDSVIWNYENSEREIVIEIDWKGEEEPKKYRVTGFVRNDERVVIPNVSVEAFSKKIGRESESLGKAETNNEGHYEVDYTKKASIPEGTIFDIFVQAYGEDGQVVARSEYYISAPPETGIDLTVSSELYRSPSEYENIADSVASLVQLEKLLTLSAEDAQFVAVKLAIEPALINRYLHSVKLEVESKSFGAANEVPAGAFYGFMRDDALLTLESLVQQSKDFLTQLLEQAVTEQRIPFSLKDRIPALVDSLKEMAVLIAARGPADPDEYSFSGLLGILTGFPADAKLALIRMHTFHEGSLDAFLQKVQADDAFTRYFESIQALFLLSELTIKNLTLVRHLFNDIQDKPGTRMESVRELARRSVEEWAAYLREPERAIKLPVKDEQGTLYTVEEYAFELHAAFSKRFPAVDLVQVLEKSDRLPGDKDLSGKFLEFFKANQQFNFRGYSVDRYFAEKATAEKQNKATPKNQDALKAELRSWQRLFKLLPDDGKSAQRAITLRDIELEQKQYDPSQLTGKAKRDQQAPVRVRKTRLDSALKLGSMKKADFIAPGPMPPGRTEEARVMTNCGAKRKISTTGAGSCRSWCQRRHGTSPRR